MNKICVLPIVMLVVLAILNTKTRGMVNGGVYVSGGHGSDGKDPDHRTPHHEVFMSRITIIGGDDQMDRIRQTMRIEGDVLCVCPGELNKRGDLTGE